MTHLPAIPLDVFGLVLLVLLFTFLLYTAFGLPMPWDKEGE